MALPDSRDTTYAVAVQVFSADLNNWQDYLVRLANLDMQAEVSAFINIAGFTPSANIEPTTALASSGAIIPITVPENWQITSIAARASDTTGGGTKALVQLQKRVGAAAFAVVAGSVINTFVAGSSVISSGALTETVVTDVSYVFNLQTPAGWTPGVFTVSQLHWTMKRLAI